MVGVGGDVGGVGGARHGCTQVCKNARLCRTRRRGACAAARRVVSREYTYAHARRELIQLCGVP